MAAPAPVVSYQLWAECSGCGWKQWIDFAGIVNVRADYEPPGISRVSVEGLLGGPIPFDMFRLHRCEP